MAENEDLMLNLNVFTTNLNKSEALKPVIFWIHGGGFDTGSSMEKSFYEGANLAKYGDVVFVSINHRLNVLGYLDLSAYGEEYAHSGNVGQADQVKALEWVRDNIASFGGDPNNVTIVGQSGGGSKVTALMSMPSAKGLFHKAVALSGGAAEIETTHEQARATAAKVLEELNITAENIKDIETVDYMTLKAAASAAGFSAGPVVDEGYMNATFEISKDIPLLMGNVFAEMSTNFVGQEQTGLWTYESIQANYLPNISREEAIERLARDHSDDEEHAEKIMAKFEELFPGHLPGEVLFMNNPLTFMNTYPVSAAMVGYGGTAYRYLQAASYPFFGGTTAIHTAGDIPLIFHNVDMIPGWVNGKTAQFKAISDQMATALCNFARTGNPTDAGLEWTKWTPDNNAVMIFDNTDGNTSRMCDGLMDLYHLMYEKGSCDSGGAG